MRVQRIVLEHHGDVAVLGVDLVDDAIADRDLPARDLLETRDHAQQRTFAAARRAHEDHELLIGDLEIDAVDDLLRVEGLANAAQTDGGQALS
jgi:hypothetical protein